MSVQHVLSYHQLLVPWADYDIFYHAKKKKKKTFSIVFKGKKMWIESTPPPSPIKKAQFQPPIKKIAKSLNHKLNM